MGQGWVGNCKSRKMGCPRGSRPITGGQVACNRGLGRATGGQVARNWGLGRATEGSVARNRGLGRTTEGSVTRNRGLGRATEGSVIRNRGLGRTTDGPMGVHWRASAVAGRRTRHGTSGAGREREWDAGRREVGNGAEPRQRTGWEPGIVLTHWVGGSALTVTIRTRCLCTFMTSRLGSATLRNTNSNNRTNFGDQFSERGGYGKTFLQENEARDQCPMSKVQCPRRG